MNIAHIDIENAKTKNVVTLDILIIDQNGDNFEFDISGLSDEELCILNEAINKELKYTDIELFYINESSIPNFGTDYNFEIKDNKLIAKLRDNIRNY